MVALFIVGMVVGFLMLFAATWCLTLFLIAQIGGWSRLAQRYMTTRDAEGQVYRRQTGQLGFARYRSCLTIGLSKEGLFLKVSPLLRLGHPPLWIPWCDVSPARLGAGFLGQYVEVALGKPPLAVLRLPPDLLQPIQAVQR